MKKVNIQNVFFFKVVNVNKFELTNSIRIMDLGKMSYFTIIRSQNTNSITVLFL